MTKDPFRAALDGFEQWTAATKRKLNADPETAAGEVETLLDLMRDYLDVEGPAGLGPGDLRELLLQIYPRKITVFDADDTEDTIPAVRDFLAYLAERGEMPESTTRALERELDEADKAAPGDLDLLTQTDDPDEVVALVRAGAQRQGLQRAA